MPTQCGPLARGRIMRITKLDECGAVVEGATSTLITESFVQVVDTPVYQDAEEIQQANANGDLCVDDQSDPALRWLDLNIQFCRVDPDKINIITGDPLVTDDAVAPNNVGFRINSALTGTANFALEVWSGVPGQACSGGFPVYGYWLYPWVRQARWAESTIANAAYTYSFTARTQAGAGWGVGPYNIRRDTTTPATLEPLLTAIGASDHKHFQFTTAPLPTAACGATELTIP